ncbi:DNA polymerase I [Lacibacterium aquatile]|uniref:DNA polymerase I n=1 Tax=Lacibacterium aquatile TaxID=1168082 RepID=A0ABW5DP93_9PROT
MADGTLYLVDGSGYIFRAFHALPPMASLDGTPVNAVFGFTNMITKLLADAGSDRLAVIFDAARVNFRNDIYPDYKAHRPPAPEELVPQFALIREATRALNVPCIEMEGYEADDLIAAYAAAEIAEGGKVVIISSDKDLMQLVRPGVTMLDPMKNRHIAEPEVFEKFGVTPDKVVDVQALCGDSVDNVPGVPGIGPKTAAELINLYGSVENLLEHLGEIKQPKRRETLENNRELALISKQLVSLKADMPLPAPLTDFEKRMPDTAVLRPFLERMNFRSLVGKVDRGELGKTVGGRPGSAISAAGAPDLFPAAVEAPKVAAPAIAQTYELVTDLATLDKWIAAAMQAGVVAVDTETTGLDASAADLIGVSMSVAPGLACYIPLGHRSQGGLLAEAPPKQIAMQEAVDRLRPLLADEGVLKVGHNLKYDMVILARHDLTVAPYDDTLLMSYVLDGARNGHGMDELSDLHLGHKTITYEEVCGKGKTQISFAEVPLDRALAYAAEDADVTLRLHSLFKRRLIEEKQVQLYERTERPIVSVVALMEDTGIRVEPDVLRRLSHDFGTRAVEMEKKVHELAGRAFNLGSPKQLGELLFGELGIKHGGKTGKTDNYSTASDVLEPLAAEYPIVRAVLDWRQITKLKSTYTDALLTQINSRTGRVHTSFGLAGTSTGRFSSSDPNLQNIPTRTEEGRKIRSAFVAPEGSKIVSVDYSQIELRLLAEIADIAALKQAFADGIDIHALTASQVFGVPLDQMDKDTRRKAKAINFGIIYGMSAFGLAANINVSQSEASSFIKAYFERYPGIKAFMDARKEEARTFGYVETLFGRRCFVPGIADKNPARRNFAERQAINAPIQGTAADIMKRALGRMPQALAEAKLNAKLMVTVHDELLFEVPEAEIETTIAVARRVMEGAHDGKVSVPLVAEAGIGNSWAEAH